VAALLEKGIETYIFGKFNHSRLDPSEFPELGRRRSQILGLPIHQQLGMDQIELIAAAAKPLIAKFGWFERT
jgi:hypothetical protein